MTNSKRELIRFINGMLNDLELIKIYTYLNLGSKNLLEVVISKK